MSSLNIPLIPVAPGVPVEESLRLHGEKFDVACVNWKEDWPYAPSCSGKIGRTEDSLLISWKVSGIGLTVRNLDDGGPIWEDSCCEFFVKAPEWQWYYNLEVNAGGHLLVGKGSGRDDRVLLPAGQMSHIVRIGGVEGPVDYAEGVFDWGITLVIPFDIFGLDASRLPSRLQGNIYKCGDKTSHPHFLSWAPIDTPAPNFHCPRFFGDFLLD